MGKAYCLLSVEDALSGQAVDAKLENEADAEYEAMDGGLRGPARGAGLPPLVEDAFRDGLDPLGQPSRSSVATWETFATASFERPVSRFRQRTLPGAPASRRFELIATATTVRMGLSLNSVDWTISTGRR